MYTRRFKMFSGLALAVTSIISLPSNIQAASLNSSTAPTVSLTATLGESLSVSITNNNVSFTLVNGTTVNGVGTVPITTTWVLGPGRTNVKLYGFFANSAQALSDGYSTPDYIASANVLGTVTGANSSASSASPFSATAPFGGASAGLQLMSQAISSSNWVGNSSNTLSLQIATPASLPAGTYTGTLTLQAQAN